MIPRRNAWSPRPSRSRKGAADPALLGERALAGQGLAQDERVDLARALVGQDGLEVVGVAHHRILRCDAVGAEDRARLPADLERLADVVELADGDLPRVELARVLERAQPP